MSIKFKKIFYSLLCAITVFFLAGFFFYVLGSEYNAVIQIAIYGIAIPVILGLAVMFTNLKKDESVINKDSNQTEPHRLSNHVPFFSPAYLKKNTCLSLDYWKRNAVLFDIT